MKIDNLTNMINGWFVGAFKPSAYSTNEVEVAVKKYNKGSKEKRHYHKIATELTLIISGKVLMNGNQYSEDDIITISPGESTDFIVLEDTTTVVVKIPGALNDKYMVEKNNA